MALMENASRAFLDAVRRSMRQVRGVVGAATVNPDLLTAAERLQYEGYLRREETNAAVRGARRGRRADQADQPAHGPHPTKVAATAPRLP